MLLLLLCMVAAASPAVPDEAWEPPHAHARLRGRIGSETVRPVTHHLLAALGAGRTRAFLVIDSLGGDLVESAHLSGTVALVAAAGVNVTCLVDGLAGTAAFTVLQHCTTRLVTPTAVLIRYRAQSTVRGMARAVAVADRAVCRLEARRVGVPFREWVAMVNAGVDARGRDAVARGFADAVVLRRQKRDGGALMDLLLAVLLAAD